MRESGLQLVLNIEPASDAGRGDGGWFCGGERSHLARYKMTQLVLSGFPLHKVLTHQIHIDDFQKGFELMESGLCGKVVCSWS